MWKISTKIMSMLNAFPLSFRTCLVLVRLVKAINLPERNARLCITLRKVDANSSGPFIECMNNQIKNSRRNEEVLLPRILFE